MSRVMVTAAGAAVALAAAGASGRAQANGQADGAGLCRVGAKVEYAKDGRRFPGKVEGDNGRNCVVYARAYMGAIDVAYADLRPDSGAPEDGAPDIAAARGTTVATTPRELIDAFRRDPAGARHRFAGTRLRITGTAGSVDEHSIWLKANLYETAAVCLVEPADRVALRGVREGAEVVVEGVGTPRGTDSLFVQQCRVVRAGTSAATQAGPARPPLGRYRCSNAGRGLGEMTLAAATYTVDGVTGGYRFDPATRRFAFAGGSYPKWGWRGEWRTDPAGPGGPPEPRIVLTGAGNVHVSCFPAH